VSRGSERAKPHVFGERECAGRPYENPSLTKHEVKEILSKASKLLQKGADHLDTPDNVKCNVTF
jgi:hypothetical protein